MHSMSMLMIVFIIYDYCVGVVFITNHQCTLFILSLTIFHWSNFDLVWFFRSPSTTQHGNNINNHTHAHRQPETLYMHFDNDTKRTATINNLHSFLSFVLLFSFQNITCVSIIFGRLFDDSDLILITCVFFLISFLTYIRSYFVYVF